eukprot:914616-Pleurochrysis_carterae.AAC.1
MSNDMLPLATLADLKLVLGNTSSPSAVTSPSADCHFASERLRAALLSTYKTPTASDILLAAGVPTFLRSLNMFPSAFACNTLQRQYITEEFSDRCAWVTSDQAGASLVERRRLRFTYVKYTTVATILAPFDESTSLI